VGDDAQLRLDAFQRIRELEARYGDSIPWSSINEGFSYMGEQVRLSGRTRGIFRPRQMGPGVLSVKTTVPQEGRVRRYNPSTCVCFRRGSV
jgi:hypothetical protein